MYLICVNAEPNREGTADYRQCLCLGRLYYVSDWLTDYELRLAMGNIWSWDLRRFRELSNVEVLIAMGNKTQFWELP